MLLRASGTGFALCAALMAGMACAAPNPSLPGAVPALAQVDLPPEPLGEALNALAAQTRSDLLFLPSVLGTQRGPRVRGRLTVEAALDLLLRNSGLTWRRTAEGTIVIIVDPEQPAATIPDILVVGRRTQDVDIRRTSNDVQPYRVATSDDIIDSHADTVDEYVRTRMPSDAAPAVDPGRTGGPQASSFNLRGLGSDQTLVLVDGARMPSLPSMRLLGQSDVNGLPVMAIDRIETITGTAGGIYGFGATAGVVNIVLDRDYRGADAAFTAGGSSRGDAGMYRVEGRFGFSPDDGRTVVEFSASSAVTGGLTDGDRPDYLLRQRALLAAHDLPNYLDQDYSADGVVLQAFQRGSGQGLADLVLKPAYGGQDLGSPLTFLPTGGAGALDLADIIANAGRIPNTLSQDGKGTTQSLLPRVAARSLIANLRHRFGGGIEAFVDFVTLDNRAASFDTVDATSLLIEPTLPTSPFSVPVLLTFPVPGFGDNYTERTRTSRLSSGLVVALPGHWRAEVNYNLGWASSSIRTVGRDLDPYAALTIEFGYPMRSGDPPLNPLGNWQLFQTSLQSYAEKETSAAEFRDYLHDASIKVAGELAKLPGGAATLTLLAEDRRERSPSTDFVLSANGITLPIAEPGSLQHVRSLYGELRAPIVAAEGGPSPWRGLELQLAVRRDVVTTTSLGVGYGDVGAPESSVSQPGLLYTVGGKVRPLNALALRASVATGNQPSAPSELVQYASPGFSELYPDPQRGGRLLGTEAPFEVLRGGSTSLKPESARTISVGMVINPDGGRWPRLSIDYSRLRKRNEVSTAYNDDVDYFLSEEAQYPGRVTREPLTAADRAAGFTGGVVTEVDTTDLNIGSTDLTAVDVDLEFSRRFRSGDVVRIVGLITWEPQYERTTAPAAGPFSLADYYDGPLTWRGNVGLQWSHERFDVGANVQYYGRYRAMYGQQNVADLNVNIVQDQGGPWIAAQAYADVFAKYRFPRGVGGKHSTELRFGVQNVLDHRPPTVVLPNEGGFSHYGDPRRRRFQLTAAVHY